MSMKLTNDFFWLVMTIGMTSLFWVPYILNRLREQGFFTGLWDPNGRMETKVDWARRMMQAHQNAVENLVVFAPLVILVQLMGLQSETTALATEVYFFARLAHYLVFTFAVPLLRVVSFLVGFGAQLTLVLRLLQF